MDDGVVEVFLNVSGSGKGGSGVDAFSLNDLFGPERTEYVTIAGDSIAPSSAFASTSDVLRDREIGIIQPPSSPSSGLLAGVDWQKASSVFLTAVSAVASGAAGALRANTSKALGGSASPSASRSPSQQIAGISTTMWVLLAVMLAAVFMLANKR